MSQSCEDKKTTGHLARMVQAAAAVVAAAAAVCSCRSFARYTPASKCRRSGNSSPEYDFTTGHLCVRTLRNVRAHK
ncbi:unnamed protein product [Lampetra planeri]